MAEGKRILFVIPWGERVILGTTDTDYDGSLEQVVASAEDVDYVLEVTNRVFPPARLQREDVLSSWAGVRPLIASRNTRKGTPSNTSRNHQIRMPHPGWIDVAGGKLTTYRLMAEQTVDRVRKHLGIELPRCRTADEPLLPADEVAGVSGVVPPPVTREVVRQCCRQEWAEHLDDVMLRRTSWHYYHSDSAAIARQVLAWMTEMLQWDEPRQAAELARMQNFVTH